VTERCIAAGMDDYVSKPDPARLARILAAWIAPTGDASPTDAVTEGTVSVMPEATLPVIDFGHLHELFGDDPPLIEELLGVFSASTETLFGKLELACERREPDAIKALAHEAKGSSANMGLRAMAAAAARLEESVASQDWQRIAALHNEMKTAWSQALLAIQSYRRNRVNILIVDINPASICCCENLTGRIEPRP
jgi:HPt (histidine-containing phosphotransfer) domain-containing protein